jgi:DNA-binding SARP family transcriptional activator
MGKPMLVIHLFGKLSLHRDGAKIESLRFGKLGELLSFLLLRRDRPHSREILASMLWGDNTTSQSRKYLRHALWQLQAILRNGDESSATLVADRDSVSLDVTGDVWLDVAVFERAWAQVHNVHHSQLSEVQAQLLKSAVDVYRADLLEGWYQEWCLFERERLQNMYLLILEKLMSYCEEHEQYDAGMEAGERILRLDRAHERTYQSMMRMQYAAGDRAGALRQYQRCESALREELCVRPTNRTQELLRTIRADEIHVARPPVSVESAAKLDEGRNDPTPGILARLRRVLDILSETQFRIEEEVEAISQELPSPKSPSKVALPYKLRGNQR